MQNDEAHRVVLETPEGGTSFYCSRNEFIWNAAARNGITLPAICHQGRCLTCAGRLLGGTVDQTSSVSYFDEDKQAGFVLLCTAKPLSELRIRTHEQWIMRRQRRELGMPAPYS
jgi:ferredoxin